LTKTSSLKKYGQVSSSAQIGKNVKIHEYAIIEDDVSIGDDVEIGANVLIANGARISDNVKIHHGAVISTPPQDLKFKGEITTLEIGRNTVIREYATLNRGTQYSNKTTVGENCFIMAYVHIAHDCIIGNNVILANSVQMGGHVEIHDWAIIGGLVGIHQFTKIGQHSIVGSSFRTVKDVPPYIVAGNLPLRYEGVNIIGLKRRGFTNEQIRNIKNIYDAIYKSGLNVSDAVARVKKDCPMSNEAEVILDFIEGSTRGIIRG
jgi:UDP-N-acetylglucosamine acyltransferase